MRGQLQFIQLRQAAEQQAMHDVVALAHRPRQPLRQHEVIAATVAQHRKTDRLEQRAIAGIGDLRQDIGQLGLQRATLGQHGEYAARRQRPQRSAGRGTHAVPNRGRALR
jgi:hypothetical protein